MSPKEQKAKAKQVLEKHQHDKSLLVDILQDIQAEIGYLPKEALEETSQGLGVPLSRVYSVATFFKAFSLTKRGRHLINVCMGTACHVRGAVKVMDKIERELMIKRGQTTKDLKFTLETVNCVGACALGPMVIIGEDYHGEMTPEGVVSVLKEYN
ncbi:MAG TPA: NADH-quinone oxidoreductase subunit NuoE [Dehalococcoidales bacterium]|nr:NADH-quinone oxidoreductase subunit NuoE [Dehalococcoidales bacterium]